MSNPEKAIDLEAVATRDLSSSNAPSETRNTIDESVSNWPTTMITESPRKLEGLLWGAVVLSILSSTFLFALDNTVVADIQPKIIEDLGEIRKLPWVSVAFALGGVSTNLIW